MYDDFEKRIKRRHIKSKFLWIHGKLFRVPSTFRYYFYTIWPFWVHSKHGSLCVDKQIFALIMLVCALGIADVSTFLHLLLYICWKSGSKWSRLKFSQNDKLFDKPENFLSRQHQRCKSWIASWMIYLAISVVNNVADGQWTSFDCFIPCFVLISFVTGRHEIAFLFHNMFQGTTEIK